VPSLTVIALFGGIRSVDSGVLAVSGTVPVPVASAPVDVEETDGLEGPEEDEDEDGDDDEDEDEDEDEDAVELVEEDDVALADWVCCRALWRAAVSALLVFVNASWLAMPARPFDKLVIAVLIAEITASLFASD